MAIACRSRIRRVALRVFWAVLVVACSAARASADENRESSPSSVRPETFSPRWTPIEFQSPGSLAGSGGLWVFAPGGIHHRLGLAGDLGISLGGATLALGPGVLRPEFEDGADLRRHEKGWSVAVQGLIYRTWPWWTTMRLPTSTTYGGADISAGYVMYRCSLGVMRALADRENAEWKLIGGIGIGLP
jgi:hypothetical protein